MANNCISITGLNPRVLRKLKDLAKRHHLSPSVAANRALTWLAKQPELIQCAVLGKFPGMVDQELAKLIIRSITKP